jgi:hypothetical protein
MGALLKSELGYATDLIGAGVNGIVSGWKERGQLRSASVRKPAVLVSAAAGLAIGILGVCLKTRRHSLGYRAVIGGLAGGALGLGVGMAWESRSLTGGAARGAVRKVNAVRDAHWLAANPIAYA